MFKQLKQQDTGLSILRTAIWVIGIFTLLSGIVGVSNIMLITVKERTREFGIRKALGAKPYSILWLIIVESVTITTIFGYLGMLAGIGATEYMNMVSGTKVVDIGVAQATVFSNPTVDISIAIQATLTLIIAGTLAGFFPARKAVMIKPIEALRAD
jgi:putative ABC transport system permease protein